MHDAIGRDRRLQAFGIQIPAKPLAACLVGIVRKNSGIELAVDIEKNLICMKVAANWQAEGDESEKTAEFSGARVHID